MSLHRKEPSRLVHAGGCEGCGKDCNWNTLTSAPDVNLKDKYACNSSK